MMETYAERLQKRKENTMTNYDMDEIERERDRNAFASVKIGESEKKSEECQSVEIDIPDEDLIKLALAAHDRDITLNQLCNNILATSLKDLDYRFEHPHQTKPTVLKEY
jgi:hypothetical protein